MAARTASNGECSVDGPLESFFEEPTEPEPIWIPRLSLLDRAIDDRIVGPGRPDLFLVFLATYRQDTCLLPPRCGSTKRLVSYARDSPVTRALSIPSKPLLTEPIWVEV